MDRVVPDWYRGLYFPSNFSPKQSSLLAVKRWPEILKTVNENSVTIIVGSPGCGKTSQVPLLLMEDAVVHRGNRSECRILVTQPRRLSAVTAAKTVCELRGWSLGSACGYHVSHAKEFSSNTRLLFATDGVVAQQLESFRKLGNYTHLIIDELHERSPSTDCLLYLAKSFLKENFTGLKLILMSATIDAGLLENYFDGVSVGVINLEGKGFSTETFYLEDLSKVITNVDEVRNVLLTRSEQLSRKSELHLDICNEKVVTAIIELLLHFDAADFEFSDEEAHSYHCGELCQVSPGNECNKKIEASALNNQTSEFDNSFLFPPCNAFNCVASYSTENNGSQLKSTESRRSWRGGVLIFVSGFFEIRYLITALREAGLVNQWRLMPLHSKMSFEGQLVALNPVTAGFRKVIVCTSVAESSLTVRDIRYVIDFCVTKTTLTNNAGSGGLNYFGLKQIYCSKASCIQRAGRVGRVRPGRVYRMITRAKYESLELFNPPAILFGNISDIVLMVKSYGLEQPRQILAKFLTPPKDHSVAAAVLYLKSTQALTLKYRGVIDLEDGELTPLGQLSRFLGIDPTFCKLIIMGYIFACLEKTVKLVACLLTEPLMSQHLDSFLCESNPEQANKPRVSMKEADFEYFRNLLFWSQGHESDAFALLNIFNAYLKLGDSGRNQDQRLKTWAATNRISLRGLTQAKENYDDLLRKLSKIGLLVTPGRFTDHHEPAVCNLLLSIAIGVAFYPNFYLQDVADLERTGENVGNENPKNTMVISGLPYDYGPVYAQAIRERLNQFVSGNFKLTFQVKLLTLPFL